MKNLRVTNPKPKGSKSKGSLKRKFPEQYGMKALAKKSAKRKGRSEVETIAMAIGWGGRTMFYSDTTGPRNPSDFWKNYITQTTRVVFRAEARAFLRALRGKP